jgi:hypothetical protein
MIRKTRTREEDQYYQTTEKARQTTKNFSIAKGEGPRGKGRVGKAAKDQGKLFRHAYWEKKGSSELGSYSKSSAASWGGRGEGEREERGGSKLLIALRRISTHLRVARKPAAKQTT